MSEPVLLYKEFIFVIDTNSHKHDFCKELVAYCTGFVHEGSVTSKYSEAFYDEMNLCDETSKGLFAEDKNPFSGYIVDREDDCGELSPCCVLLNKNYAINDEGDAKQLEEANYDEYCYPAPFSVGIFFDKYPEQSQIEILKSRAIKFFKEVWIWPHGSVGIEGFRIIVHSKYGEEIFLD